MKQIQCRAQYKANTEPQRRCYNGEHFSSEWRWTDWGALETFPETLDNELRLTFWRELNKIATDGRGRSALCEYRVVEVADAFADYDGVGRLVSRPVVPASPETSPNDPPAGEGRNNS